MTKQEILETIHPCVMMHRAAGDDIEITMTPEHLWITPGKDGAFGAMFIHDLAAVCVENYIGFAIGAERDPVQPFIIL